MAKNAKSTGFGSGWVWVARLVLLFALIGLGVPLGIYAGRHFSVDMAGWAFLVLGMAALVITVYAARVRIRFDQLKRQKEIIFAVLEGSQSARLVSDPDGHAIFANAEFGKLIGVVRTTEVDALARLFENTPESAGRFELLHLLALEGKAGVAELEVRSDNHVSFLLIGVRPVSGLPGYIHWSVTDVTMRREMERTVEEQNVRMADFMDHAPVGFFSVDGQGHFRFVNLTLAEWLGVSVDELLSGACCLHDFLSVPPKNAAPYDLSEAGGPLQRGEILLRARDGRVFQADITHMVVHEEGDIIRTRSVVHDLTPELEWEQALEISERRFRRLFEEAPIGIALMDSKGIIEACNQALAEMVGTARQDLVGTPLRLLLAAENDGEVLDQLGGIMAGAEMKSPMDLTLRGGKEVHAQLYARRSLAGEGQPGLILHFIDTTERRKLENQFVQSQKMQAIGQLAGGVAHDFNNLLTAMIGFCDLLLLRHKPGDASFGDIMQIKQNANRASNLVRQLLAFSRQQTLQPRVLDMTDLITEISHLLRRLIGENVELRIVHGRNPVPVKGDQGQLEQVLINLVVNARDAMPGGGRVTVSTENITTTEPSRPGHGAEDLPPGEWLKLEVADTGVGIPGENLGRIFDPFFSTKAIGQGTGLGLSTVYGIVKQTSGYVFVNSAPGEGAAFSIYLPHFAGTVSQLSAESLAHKPAEDLTGAGRILLVEDEEAVRLFSARALRNKGYEVFETDSGEAALALLNEAPGGIDLLISDIIMPQMDGPTLVRQVRERHPSMKVIFISGYAEERFREHIDAERGVHFLPKPFSLKQLAGKVKEVLGGEGKNLPADYKGTLSY